MASAERGAWDRPPGTSPSERQPSPSEPQPSEQPPPEHPLLERSPPSERQPSEPPPPEQPPPGRPPPEIVLVRHGETSWSRDGRHTGRTDLPLTAAGRRQAELLAGPLGGRTFAQVLTSPLQRARETCRLAGLDGAAEPRAALAEWDYGAYEGRTTAAIRAERPGWSLWRDGAPDGESAADLQARVDPVVWELRQARGDIAVFAHGHVLRVLTARWLDLPASDGRLFALGTATLSVLGWERETPVILAWNQPSSAAMDAPW